MKRTTVFIEESVDRDLQALARRQARPRSELVREALDEYLEKRRRSGLGLSFVASGSSGRSDIAERHEEHLFKNLEPHPKKPRTGEPETEA